jgi:S-adenosyl methyltransferase
MKAYSDSERRPAGVVRSTLTGARSQPAPRARAPSSSQPCRGTGGTASFPADRAAVARILELVPEIRDAAWANRGFLQRAVRWMAARGISQFIDLGAGLPTQRCTHEVARTVIPDARVVYTDNDSGVVAHGHQILRGVPGTAVIEADIRRPDQLLGHAEFGRLIDLAEPAGLLILAVTQFIPDEDDPWALVARYAAALAPGSYLALSAPTADHMTARKVERILGVYSTVHRPPDYRPQQGQHRPVLHRPGCRAALRRRHRGPDPRRVVGLRGPRGRRQRRLPLVLRRRRPQAGDLVTQPQPAKPTIAQLGVDPDALAWRGSGRRPGTIEVAFTTAKGQDWALLRIAGDPDQRVSVFTCHEWDCFLDGAKNGEFDLPPRCCSREG